MTNAFLFFFFFFCPLFAAADSSCAQKSTHQWLGKKYEGCVQPLERPAKVKGFREVRERLWKGKKYTVGAKPILDELDSEEVSKKYCVVGFEFGLCVYVRPTHLPRL